MGLNNKEFYIKKIRRTLLYSFLFFLFLLNVMNFFKHSSSNLEYAVEYKKPIDKFADFRNPLNAVMFTDKENKIKILILPYNIIENKNVKKIKFLKQNNSVVLWNKKNITPQHISFLEKQFNFLIEDKESNFNSDSMIVAFDDTNNLSADFRQIKKLALENDLKPQVFDFLDTKPVKKIVEEKPEKNEYLLNEQHNNLQNFVRDYNVQLVNLIKDYKNYKITDTRLKDKGDSVVLACDKNNNCFEFGNFDFEQSIVKSIADNLSKADKTYPNLDKKVFLVTKPEKKIIFEEKDLYNTLDTDIGVILKKGNLISVMLPHFWKQFPDKKDFIRNLKIKAGMNPDYWSDDILIYYFKAVEV